MHNCETWVLFAVIVVSCGPHQSLDYCTSAVSLMELSSSDTDLHTALPKPASTLLSSHNTLESGLEPLDSIILRHFVLLANLALASPSLRNTCTRSAPNTIYQLQPIERTISHSHAAVEVHPIDTNCRVIFDTKIDVF
jgi:hypothetical protein